MQDAVMKIIEGVVCLATLVVMRYVIPWVKSHASEAQIQTAKLIIDAAVFAAQQTMKDELGTVKKASVKGRVLNELEEHGIYISEEQLNDLIEAAVKTMKIEEARAA